MMRQNSWTLPKTILVAELFAGQLPKAEWEISIERRGVGNPVYDKEAFAPTHAAKVESEANAGDKRLLSDDDSKDSDKKLKHN